MPGRVQHVSHLTALKIRKCQNHAMIPSESIEPTTVLHLPCVRTSEAVLATLHDDAKPRKTCHVAYCTTRSRQGASSPSTTTLTLIVLTSPVAFLFFLDEGVPPVFVWTLADAFRVYSSSLLAMGTEHVPI